VKDEGQIEELISQRERELTDFVENAVVGLHWVAADGTILWANQAELDLLGYTREEYIGHHIAEFHADHEVIHDIIKRLAAGENLINYDAQMRCKDGSIRHVLISSSVRFEDEQFIHTRCFTVDITERKRAENRIILLYQLTAALSEALTPQQVAKVITEPGIAALGASAGSVVLLDESKKQLEILIAVGYSEKITQEWQQFSVDSPVVLSQCVRTRQPIWLPSFAELQTRFPAMSHIYNDGEYTAWAAIPLIVEKHIIGALGLSFSTPQTFNEQDRRFMVAVAQQGAQALERARLSEESRDLAVLEERQRIARDLHDAVSQTLFSIGMLAQSLPRLWERDQERARDQLRELVTISQSAIAEMRTLLLELRPAKLVKSSLQELFTQLIDAAQARKPIMITCHVELHQPLPENVHIVLYRVAQESINNIVKHGGATQGSITLTTQANQIVLIIQDNGQGFEMRESASGMGLGVMHERAALIGAQLEIKSAVGKGTEITLKWTPPTSDIRS
jgi:PAS domain S-box-containing protein